MVALISLKTMSPFALAKTTPITEGNIEWKV
jgi:hypothetical protein